MRARSVGRASQRLQGFGLTVGVLTAGLLASLSARAQPSLDLRIYSHFQAVAEDRPSYSHFELGSVDIFAVSSINDEIRVLNEDVLKLTERGPSFGIMRLYVDYTPTEWLQLRLGRDHTPLGYFLQAYHHAQLFQPATARPVVSGFEAESGVLPVHFVGLVAHGSRPLIDDGLSLSYDLGVGNGRGQVATDVQSLGDRNSSKAWVGRLAFQVDAVEGLELGVSGYLDRIPGGHADTRGNVLVPEDLDESIVGAHISYRGYPVEVMTEAYRVQHRGVDSGRDYELLGGYAHLGYSLGKFTPYTRYDYLWRDSADPFYNASASPPSAADVRAGIRYQPEDRVVLKLEYARVERRAQRVHLGVLQAAFGF